MFVNGQNLGRYWKIGPQETLYLPGPWLWRGSNEVRGVGGISLPVCDSKNPALSHVPQR